jgi:hypothetical protein
MKELMSRYLHQRVKKRLDVYERLPSMITNMHTYLCAELGLERHQEQEECMASLCEGFHRIFGWEQIARSLWGQITGHPILNRHIKESQAAIWPRDKLTAAVAVHAYSLVPGILLELPDKTAKHEQTPLELAVKQGDDELLRIILEHLASLTGDVHNVWTHFGFSAAVTYSLVYGNKGHAKLILAGLYRARVGPESRVYRNWLSLALKPIEKKQPTDKDLVQNVLQIRPPNAPRVFVNRFREVCDAGDFELAKILLAHMELDRGLIRNLPLNSAIRTKNLDLIGAVLDAGADINIRAHKRDKVKEQKESEKRSSLEVAMGFGPEVVDYLIQRGAVIPPLSAWVKGDRQVYNILRDGVFDYQDKNKRLPTYPEFRDMTTKERRKY